MLSSTNTALKIVNTLESVFDQYEGTQVCSVITLIIQFCSMLPPYSLSLPSFPHDTPVSCISLPFLLQISLHTAPNSLRLPHCCFSAFRNQQNPFAFLLYPMRNRLKARLTRWKNKSIVALGSVQLLLITTNQHCSVVVLDRTAVSLNVCCRPNRQILVKILADLVHLFRLQEG